MTEICLYEQHVKSETHKVIHKEYGDVEVKVHIDAKNREIAFKNSMNYWKIFEYDNQGNKIFEQDSNGNWEKRKYANNTIVQYTDSMGTHWVKGGINP